MSGTAIQEELKLSKKHSLKDKLIRFFDEHHESYTPELEIFEIFKQNGLYYMPSSISRICRNLAKKRLIQKRLRAGTNYEEYYK